MKYITASGLQVSFNILYWDSPQLGIQSKEAGTI